MKKTQYQLNKEWRKRHPEIRHAGKKRYYQKTQRAPNEYKRFEETDEDSITAHNIFDSELSKLIGRSIASIQCKRCKLLKKEREEGY